MTEEPYKAHDSLLDKVFSNTSRLGIQSIILGGGTALARYYLHHRVSYDLDFFVGGSFSPERLSITLGQIGVTLSDVHIEDGGRYARQLHGYAVVNDSMVKVSFVEDVYEGMWPKRAFGSVTTEEIGGLYHRKLRTISGSGYGKNTTGARQTARDLFDAYVLNQGQPIHEFIAESNKHGANFPVDAFCANLLGMPWIDLMDEFEGLDLLAPYLGTALIGDVKPALINEALRLQNLVE